MPKRPKAARGVRANARIRERYQRALQSRIQRMHRSIMRWVVAGARPLLASDADPADRVDELQRTIDRLVEQWTAEFDAERLARRFGESVDTWTQNQVKRSMPFSVSFQQTPEMRTAVEAVIAENVGLIRSIPEQHLQAVQGLVMRSISEGRSLYDLKLELSRRYGITRKRAALIARDQNNKASGVMSIARTRSVGITKGIWKHSRGGAQPRKSHVAADGDEFDLDKGMYIDGEWIKPGQLINCRCYYKPVLPF